MAIREYVRPADTSSKARGCPRCGSHDTSGISTRGGAQWCNFCDLKWLPCAAHCRGYVVDVTGPYPEVRGCKECGVPDRIARWWPEAYKALNAAMLKDLDKMAPVKTAPSLS